MKSLHKLQPKNKYKHNKDPAEEENKKVSSLRNVVKQMDVKDKLTAKKNNMEALKRMSENT